MISSVFKFIVNHECIISLKLGSDNTLNNIFNHSKFQTTNYDWGLSVDWVELVFTVDKANALDETCVLDL